MELNEHIIQYLAFIEKRQLDKKTMKAYREDLRQFSDSTNGEYTEAKLLQYVNSLQEKYTAATAQRKVATLKAFLEYLYENGALKSNPLHKYIVLITAIMTIQSIANISLQAGQVKNERSGYPQLF